MARLRSSVVVAAISRLAAQKNGASYVRRRGSEEAGSIFITLYDRQTRNYALYEPVPQALASDQELDRDSRAFSLIEEGQDDIQLAERFEREAKFDPDFWIIDVEGMSRDELGEAVLIV